MSSEPISPKDVQSHDVDPVDDEQMGERVRTADDSDGEDGSGNRSVDEQPEADNGSVAEAPGEDQMPAEFAVEPEFPDPHEVPRPRARGTRRPQVATRAQIERHALVPALFAVKCIDEQTLLNCWALAQRPYGQR